VRAGYSLRDGKVGAEHDAQPAGRSCQPGPIPTVPRLGEQGRTDPETAASLNQGSRSSGKFTVMRQGCGQARKSVFRLGSRSAQPVARQDRAVAELESSNPPS